MAPDKKKKQNRKGTQRAIEGVQVDAEELPWFPEMPSQLRSSVSPFHSYVYASAKG
jgi:hypothetical protein